MRHQLVIEVLRRAAARGEIDPRPATPLLAAVPAALLMQHFLAHGAPIPDGLLVEIVDDVVLPLAHRPPRHRPAGP